jgi:antitoxin VapB
MATSLNIKDAETSALVRELARMKGQSLTEAVKEAVQNELTLARKRRSGTLAEDLLAIGRRVSAYPVYDDRPLEEMLYDEGGLPK